MRASDHANFCIGPACYCRRPILDAGDSYDRASYRVAELRSALVYAIEHNARGETIADLRAALESKENTFD